jgi:hypothetical protein
MRCRAFHRRPETFSSATGTAPTISTPRATKRSVVRRESSELQPPFCAPPRMDRKRERSRFHGERSRE